MRPLHFVILTFIVARVCSAGAQTLPKNAMKELRKMALTRSATELEFKRDKAFPTTFGLVVDFPIGDQTATVVSLRDGTTSLYTTGTFGIIGGGEHKTVSKASTDLIRLAQSFWPAAKSTKSVSYPAKGHVRFYLLGYDGVRFVETTVQSVNGRKDRYNTLWVATNRVVTELRTHSGVR